MSQQRNHQIPTSHVMLKSAWKICGKKTVLFAKPIRFVSLISHSGCWNLRAIALRSAVLESACRAARSARRAWKFHSECPSSQWRICSASGLFANIYKCTSYYVISMKAWMNIHINDTQMCTIHEIQHLSIHVYIYIYTQKLFKKRREMRDRHMESLKSHSPLMFVLGPPLQLGYACHEWEARPGDCNTVTWWGWYPVIGEWNSGELQISPLCTKHQKTIGIQYIYIYIIYLVLHCCYTDFWT